MSWILEPPTWTLTRVMGSSSFILFSIGAFCRKRIFLRAALVFNHEWSPWTDRRFPRLKIEWGIRIWPRNRPWSLGSRHKGQFIPKINFFMYSSVGILANPDCLFFVVVFCGGELSQIISFWISKSPVDMTFVFYTKFRTFFGQTRRFSASYRLWPYPGCSTKTVPSQELCFRCNVH